MPAAPVACSPCRDAPGRGPACSARVLAQAAADDARAGVPTSGVRPLSRQGRPQSRALPPKQALVKQARVRQAAHGAAPGGAPQGASGRRRGRPQFKSVDIFI